MQTNLHLEIGVMILKNKKGFTLIELIIAMAILAIAMTAFSMAISSSTSMVRGDKTKMDNLSYGQYVIQTLKTKGLINLTNFYYTKSPGSETSDTKTPYECYFYFNDKSQLNTVLDSFIPSNTLINAGSYNTMIQNKGTNTYGAYLKIYTVKPEKYDAAIMYTPPENVRLEIKVLNLKSKYQKPTNIVYYLGR